VNLAVHSMHVLNALRNY